MTNAIQRSVSVVILPLTIMLANIVAFQEMKLVKNKVCFEKPSDIRGAHFEKEFRRIWVGDTYFVQFFMRIPKI